MLAFCIVTFYFVNLSTADAQIGAATVDQVKSVYLFNFSLFVTWPSDSFSGANDSIRYCVRQNESIGPTLRKAIQNEVAGGRPLEYVELNNASTLKNCHILYFSGDYPEALRDYNRHTQGSRILVVTDNPEFVEFGAAIGLTLKGNRIHPSINMSVVQSAQYTISAKLMSLATRIEAEGK